ncbi:hypothetical protein MHU86_11181 [Fragilaria crotonensis]|nr:hypothetical protein MHU86_11181 [Fragilaria crotonensis]
MMDGAFTVVDALIACGVNNIVLFMEQTQAQRIAVISLIPSLLARISHSRSSMNTSRHILILVPSYCLIRRYHTHEKYKTDSRTLAEAAKPEKFKEATKWEDWKPTFVNNLRAIPGRDGVPLKYICREHGGPVVEENADFLDDYVAMAPLDGDAYAIDTVQVHTFLVNFVAGNDTAEAKIQGLAKPNDGREAFKRLVEHYEGVGIHAVDIREADEVIKSLFYSGERPPHMWWSEFEKRLTRAFNAYVKREGRVVYSNSMKIRLLIDKIKADFLNPTKAQLEIELSRVTHFSISIFCIAFLSVTRSSVETVLRLLVPITMTEGTVPSRLLSEYILPPDNDPLFGFETTSWFEPSSFDMIPPETEGERYRRLSDETIYRQSITTTHWHRHSIIGYNIDILEVYPREDKPLEKNWASQQDDESIQKEERSRPHANLQLAKRLLRLASNLPSQTSPAPIPEETDESGDTNGQQVQAKENNTRSEKSLSSNSMASSHDAKQSALIPNLSIPLNDGTHRVTFRIQMTIDTRNVEKQSDALNQSIYDFLVKVFLDSDGMLYNWHSEGLENPRVVSQMSPSEVRTYLPSVTVSPTQSLVVIATRFGFNSKNPTPWRNNPNTTNNLNLHKATVAISNSKSVGGKHVVAGYILLKAPNLTHRVRYLQYLRGQLPDATPYFDIFLHRQTPLEQKIDHLAILCGERYVHSLSQALLNFLDGSKIGVYLPRFAFESMSTEQIQTVFAKHDAYVKSLRMIPLAPFITNIDTLRSEHFPNGTTKERSTREWCLSLTEADSTTSIKCDVVNGGYDQKAYMLVPPQHYERVLSEFSDYKGRVFPFRQREERFRSSIGRPPAVIEITRQKINESLAIFDSLVSPTESGRNDATIATKPASKDADRRGSSVSSRFSSNTSISESTVDSYQGQQSIASLPLRQHRNQDDQTVTTASSNSGKATSISSTQARFHELDAIWKRQRKDHDKLSKITDDRLSQMERQFHRLDTIDKSLQDFNTSHEEHKLRFRGLESQVVQFMERQVTMGDNVLSIEDKINSLISVVTSLAASKEIPVQAPPQRITPKTQFTSNLSMAPTQFYNLLTREISIPISPALTLPTNQCHTAPQHRSRHQREKKYALLHPAAPIPILQSVHRHTRSILAN